MTGVKLRPKSGKTGMAEITGNMVVGEVRKRFLTLALPREANETKEIALRRAARECHLSERQARRLVEDQLGDVKGSVFLNVFLRFVEFQEEIRNRAEQALRQDSAFIQALETGSTHGDDAALHDDGGERGEGRDGMFAVKDRP